MDNRGTEPQEKEQQSISIKEWWDLAGKLDQEGQKVPLHFKVTGGSMVPLIRNGMDEVVVFRREGAVKKGDIVLFKGKTCHADYIIHRVYRVEGNQILTLGDGNLAPDFWMPLTNVYGVAAFLRRGSRRLDLESGFMRVYGSIWMALLPMRRYLLKLGEWCCRVKEKGRQQ